MKNRFRTSVLSPLSVLSLAQPPVEARLNAILAPQRRQRLSRAITLLASTVAVVATIALASVQVNAGQKPASLQSPPAQVVGSAGAEHAVVSQEGYNAAHLSVASEEQSSSAQPSTQSQQNSSTDETAKLRKKLDALQYQLTQQQQENAKLRQHLKDLQAQKRARTDMDRAISAQELADAKREVEQASGPMNMQGREAIAAEIAKFQAILRDLQAQQMTLQKRRVQAENLYRAGAATSQGVDFWKEEEKTNRAQIAAAEQHLRSLEIRKKLTETDQKREHDQLTLQLYQIRLAQAQQNLEIAQGRSKAGVATAAEVEDAVLKVSQIQAEIAKLKVKMAQEETA